MNIKSMLLRLQGALGQDNLSEQMLLYPGNCDQQAEDTGNFVIGYNGSPNSQTALDFILWMAHQTRLATQKQVMVHVVYVIDCYNSLSEPSATSGQSSALSANQGLNLLTLPAACQLSSSEKFGFQCDTNSITQPHLQPHQSQRSGGAQVMERPSASSLTTMLEQVDRILWQARCLSDEWRGSVEAHLRFGGVATELREVIEAQSADLLFVGCSDINHSLVQQLAPCLACPILGIPTELEAV
jgi:nucleotide-binding universal stress UspA family protein